MSPPYATMTIMVIFFFAVLGVIFGSFINALTWRMHEQAKLAGKKGKAATRRREQLSITKGRSMCPNCGHALAAKDLVPIVSWLLLRGRCRYCGARIPDSPLVELITGVLFAVSYYVWPYNFNGVGLFTFAVWIVLLVAFMALVVFDMRWLLLPNKIVFPLVAAALVEVIVVAIWRHSPRVLWLAIAGGVTMFGLFWILFQVSKGAWIGGGDVKLALALGLLAGTPYRALTVIFLASLAGTIISIPVLVKGKSGFSKHVPFGPSLILGTIIMVLWGASIVSWYQGLIIK